MNPFAFFDDVTKKVVEGKVVGVYMDFSEAFQKIGWSGRLERTGSKERELIG